MELVKNKVKDVVVFEPDTELYTLNLKTFTKSSVRSIYDTLSLQRHGDKALPLGEMMPVVWTWNPFLHQAEANGASACRYSKCRNDAPVISMFKGKFRAKQSVFPELCLGYLELVYTENQATRQVPIEPWSLVKMFHFHTNIHLS